MLLVTIRKLKKGLLFFLSVVCILTIPYCSDKSVNSENDQLDYTPPSNLVFNVLPLNKIQLSWTVNSKGVRTFSVERRIGVFGTYQPIRVGSIEMTSIIDSIPNLDSVYFYRIRVNNLDHYGPYSEEAAINVALAAPSALTLISLDDQTVKISWSDNSNSETGFLVERKGAGGNYVTAGITDSNVTVFSDTGQLNGSVEYSYHVKALGESDFGVTVASVPSNEIKITPVFAAPTNLTVSASSETSAVLHWSDNTNSESKFVIEKKSSGNYILRDSLDANSTTYTDLSTFQTNFYYSYRVRAVSSRRISPYSNTDSGMVIFQKPTNFVVATTPEKGISLSWNDNSSFESGFQIEQKAPGSAAFVPLQQIVPANSTSFFDSSTRKVDGSFYVYRIRAISPKGNVSDYSTIDSVKFVFNGPSDITINSLTQSSVQLNWQNNSTFEEGIKVERTNLISNKKDSITLNAGTVSNMYNDLDNRSAYQFRIKAFKGAHESRYSPPFRVTMSATNFAVQHVITDTTEILAVAADTSGSFVAVGGLNGIVRIYSVADGTTLGSLITDSLSSVRALAISPRNDRIAVAYDGGMIRMWDLTNDSLIWKKNSGSTAYTVSWQPSGATFATGHADQLIRIWDQTNGTIVRTLSGHQSAVFSLRYSYAGTSLVSGSADQSLKIWNSATGAEIKTIPTAHTGTVNSVTFVHSGDSLVVSAGSDGLIRIWQVTTGKNIATLSGNINNATALISPDLLSIISVGNDGAVKLWKGGTWSLAETIIEHSAPITSLSLSLNKKIFATGGMDKKILIWNLESLWTEW